MDDDGELGCGRATCSAELLVCRRDLMERTWCSSEVVTGGFCGEEGEGYIAVIRRVLERER